MAKKTAKRKTTKETFSRYDSAEYLRSEEDIVAYLQACLAEAGDDAAFIAHSLGVVARAHGMMQLSRETGLSREALYKALSNDGNPTLDTVLKVMKAFGLKLSAETA